MLHAAVDGMAGDILEEHAAFIFRVEVKMEEVVSSSVLVITHSSAMWGGGEAPEVAYSITNIYL